MRLPALACVPFACLLGLASAQSFVDVTPSGAVINRSVSLDPRDPAHLLVESSTLFESFDGGNSWVNLASLTGNIGAFDGNGDLVFASSSTPVSAGQTLRRRTSSGLEVLSLPSVTAGDPEQFISGVICHPTRPDSLAILTIADDPVSGDILQRVYLTLNGGDAWNLVELAVSDGNSYQNLGSVEFVPNAAGGGLLVSWTYEELRFSTATVFLWDLDLSGASNEVSVTDSSCGVAAPRTLPGRRYAFESNGPVWMPGPVAIQRRDPGGTYGPVGDQGFFRDVAAGKVDPELVLRLEPQNGSIVLSASRDGGQTWSLLLDAGAAGYSLESIFGLTSTDGHAYVRARETTLNERRLLRVPVETLVSDLDCAGVPNSTGRAGALAAIGQPEASANRYLLSIRDLPAGTFNLPIAGRDAGFVV
ncbi:MAG: hypothetical protein AAGG01_08695, partial [Planctomycetota bacterium]